MTRVQKYGLTLFVTTDPELTKYLNSVVEEQRDWLYKMFSAENGCVCVGSCRLLKVVRSLKDGSLILSVARLPKITEHPEENFRK